ncbi:crotonase/enoyl-CoA hydratase family protein [Halocynthiibacter namhaensis]|uniref:crotonase/enoyl-CoA hydratase family protein n=1 Tax=Halocynthiibacter namhaensis TaxID=1290553 RepID=UPI00057928B0|nr:crotonase/enoyl-CoA hydratase family protein [Halocynthiibacter namhaensis]
MNARVTVTEANQIAFVALSRPEKRNALDLQMLEEISDTGASLASRNDIRAVILHGEGNAFSAGLDLNEIPKLAQYVTQNGGIMKRSHGDANLFQHVTTVWRSLPQPVICALHGYAFGGAFQIMLGADIRIASPDCQFSIMEGRWGLIPDMGGVALMRRLAREDVVRNLTYTADKFTARDALSWGFITELADDALARATEIAQGIVEKSPDAVRAAKELFNRTELTSEAATLLIESELQGRLIGTPNQMEAVVAGLQKRAPDFKD